jgi:hypothetical protein
MDGEHARLLMSDLDFCHRLLARLEDQLAFVERKAERVSWGCTICRCGAWCPIRSDPLGLRQRFPRQRVVRRDSARSSPGALRRLRHSHKPDRFRHAHFECVNVGCTYLAKRYEIIEL